MRLSVLCIAFLAAVAANPGAYAQPVGVKSKDGVWTTVDGKPLHISRGLVGVTCYRSEPCQERWDPLVAPGELSPHDDWSTIADPGSKSGWVWAYRGYVLYTEAPPGSAPVSPWAPKLRPAIRLDGEIVNAAKLEKLAPPRWIEPAYKTMPPPLEYYIASIRARETGDVTIAFCIDREGKPVYPQVIRSPGFPRLEEASINWIERIRFTPPQLDGRPVTLCNRQIDLTWQIPELGPPIP